jgi:hypothetical protein
MPITRILILSAAAWAAAGIAAGTLRTTQETAPAPALESTGPVLAAIELKADREPLAPQGKILDRWPELATALVVQDPPAPVTVEEAAVWPQLEPKKLTRHRQAGDRVCGARGRHWYTRRHGWRYWRCNR